MLAISYNLVSTVALPLAVRSCSILAISTIHKYPFGPSLWGSARDRSSRVRPRFFVIRQTIERLLSINFVISIYYGHWQMLLGLGSTYTIC